MGLYVLFTVKTTAWRYFEMLKDTDLRTKFRKQANAADNKAATIIIDSLINYEAVKVHTLWVQLTASTSITRNIKSSNTI
jgi:ABC-type transport system involved in Fe-S cluster assembly fused permease/ATPase subunit